MLFVTDEQGGRLPGIGDDGAASARGRAAADHRAAARPDVRVALLAALHDGPRHGPELMDRVEARSGDSWRPGACLVYPMLLQLVDEGFVSVAAADGKSQTSGGSRGAHPT